MVRLGHDGEHSLAEHVCLALVVELSPAHGWAIAKELADDGPIGRIWTLTKPNTYRTLDVLTAKGLIFRSAMEQGRGAAKVPLAATDEGLATNATWLERPVHHVRHVRSELLLKLTFRNRCGLETTDFSRRQREQLRPTFAAIAAAPTHLTDPVALWRWEQAAAVQRFLDLLAGHQ